MLTLFVVLQIVLLFFMLFHDWISVRPLNDIPALKSKDSTLSRLVGSLINGSLVLIPLILTLFYYSKPTIPFFIGMTVMAFYLLLTIGTILSWWVPYLFGSTQKLKKHFSKFKNTHHFLPPIKDHIVPNTQHVILHLQVWICLGLSIYYLITKTL